MSGLAMNEFSRISARFPSFAPALALALAACGGPAETPPLAGARLGGPFALIGEDGATVRDSDFAGRYRLIYFGYTSCPDVCPLDAQNIGAGMRLLEREDPDLAGRVQPIFVTVDPARDTPAVLARFTDAFHPRMIGLTGSQAQIAAVARAYGVAFDAHDEGGEENYLVDHSRQAMLFGPDGAPIALIPQDESAEAVAAEIRRWAS
ncbi:MAG: SCO family protein [Sphingomonadaceae bacterium]|nr:SCO family protein [Sphingomonadaceae bacterium]